MIPSHPARMPLPGVFSSRQDRFETLVFPHLDRLVAFAARQVGNVSDAEDAVQEACIRAWQGFDQLRDEDRVRAWLYQILRTTVCDLREREGKIDMRSCHGSLHREHMAVPFLINHPVEDRARVPRSVDAFPTILQLLGRPSPAGVDGRSLVAP